MNVMAIDIATHLGWCRGEHTDPTPRFGSVKFGVTGASSPARFSHALRWAVETFKGKRLPDVLVLERSIPVRAFSSDQTASILFGLAGVIQGVAYECGLYRFESHAVGDVRSIFIGARGLPTTPAKAAVVRRCRQLGWMVPDHDAADACALWAYHVIEEVAPQPLLNRLAQCPIVVPDTRPLRIRPVRRGLRLRIKSSRGGVLFA
jgi:hypothetical protein